MSLLVYAVFFAGTVSLGVSLGHLVHEALHFVVARTLTHGATIGWVGGIAGGPSVFFRTDNRWRSEAIRKAPLVVGALGAVAVVVSYRAPTLWWGGLAGVTLGLLSASPQDLFIARARASAETFDDGDP